MDADNVDYRSDLAAIRETFGTLCVPFNVPVGQGATFSGVVDVIQSHDEDPAALPRWPPRKPIAWSSSRSSSSMKS